MEDWLEEMATAVAARYGQLQAAGVSVRLIEVMNEVLAERHLKICDAHLWDRLLHRSEMHLRPQAMASR